MLREQLSYNKWRLISMTAYTAVNLTTSLLVVALVDKNKSGPHRHKPASAAISWAASLPPSSGAVAMSASTVRGLCESLISAVQQAWQYHR
jgi:hypothetical protein